MTVRTATPGDSRAALRELPQARGEKLVPFPTPPGAWAARPTRSGFGPTQATCPL